MWVLAIVPALALAALGPDLQKSLGESKFIYIQSTRKSGELSEPAEMWFLYDGGKIYVGTRPTSWRDKRIKWGRKKAHITVGKPGGPALDAVGEIIHDPALEGHLMDAYAKKYPDLWPTYRPHYVEGFPTGARILIRYTPK